MSNCKYLILCILLFSSDLFAQSVEDRDITGLWKGTLYNDTTQQYYRYEIAISEEKGKLTGYSHTWFILDDKQYYGVKKVKIRRTDGKILVEDAGLIANNYPVQPAKNVRQLNVLTLQIMDSVMLLTGPFSTNRTKDYRSLTGSINVQRRNDFRQSALVPHLQELDLAKQLSFVQEEEKAIAKKQAEAESVALLNKSGSYTPDVVASNVKPQSQKTEIVKSGTTEVEIAPVTPPPIAKAAPPAKKIEPPVVKVPVAAENVSMRNTELQQTVYFKTDSLQLSLYDNGEVDGDTVSVLMNGNIIFAKERLSTNAVRKTISIDPSQDSIQLVMYAENLGTIAPNTGLLVVRDGKDIYEIRFSGDLKKNAAIVFKRKK
jgi:hypothetical protein